MCVCGGIQALYTGRWKDVNPSINEGRLYSHNGTISEYMVSSVLPAYSAETAEPPHSSPLESSSQILCHTESPSMLSCWSRHQLWWNWQSGTQGRVQITLYKPSVGPFIHIVRHTSIYVIHESSQSAHFIRTDHAASRTVLNTQLSRHDAIYIYLWRRHEWWRARVPTSAITIMHTVAHTSVPAENHVRARHTSSVETISQWSWCILNGHIWLHINIGHTCTVSEILVQI